MATTIPPTNAQRMGMNIQSLASSFRNLFQNNQEPPSIMPEPTLQRQEIRMGNNEKINTVPKVMQQPQQNVVPQFEDIVGMDKKTFISSFDDLFKTATTTLHGTVKDAFHEQAKDYGNQTAYWNSSTGDQYIRYGDKWVKRDGTFLTESEIETDDIASSENKSLEIQDELLNELSKLAGTDPIAAPTQNANTEPESTGDLASDIQRIAKQQQTLDYLRSAEYLSNAIGAMLQDPSKGFVAPEISYTETPSLRDRDLAEMNRQVAAGKASTSQKMEEYGMTDLLSTIEANAQNALAQGRNEIGNREMQILAGNIAGINDAVNKNAIAKATTENQNIEKTMRENQALGAEYTGNMENFFRTMTDINRQKVESKIASSLAESPKNFGDLVGMYLHAGGFSTPTKRKYQEEE